MCRFLLATLVVVVHLDIYSNSSTLRWISKFGAFEAILGFLLISGYSIGYSFLRNPHIFFIRRAKRIYPIYIISMILVLCTGDQLEINKFFIYLLFINCFFLNQIFTSGSLIGPAWSLSLEVWLYALVPFFKKLRHSQMIFLAITSFILFSLYTLGRSLFHWPYFAGLAYGLNLPLLAFPWLLGCLLAWVEPELRPKILKLILLTLGSYMLLIVSISFGYHFKRDDIHGFFSGAPDFFMKILTLIGIWFALKSSTFETQKKKPVPWMLLLGDISYPLYLIHCTVFSYMHRNGIRNSYFMLGTAFFCAFFIYKIFDQYSQKRRH